MSRAETTCPYCGLGTLTDLAFDEPAGTTGEPQQQSADSRQVLTYSCGHREVGGSLANADPERLDVERRHSEETVDPSPTEEADDGPTPTVNRSE